MSRGLVHRRPAAKGAAKIILSQLVDWDRPGALILDVRDLETDDLIVEVPVIELDGSKAVLVSLRYDWRRR